MIEIKIFETQYLAKKKILKGRFQIFVLLNIENLSFFLKFWKIKLYQGQFFVKKWLKRLSYGK